MVVGVAEAELAGCVIHGLVEWLSCYARLAVCVWCPGPGPGPGGLRVSSASSRRGVSYVARDTHGPFFFLLVSPGAGAGRALRVRAPSVPSASRDGW